MSSPGPPPKPQKPPVKPTKTVSGAPLPPPPPPPPPLPRSTEDEFEDPPPPSDDEDDDLPPPSDDEEDEEEEDMRPLPPVQLSSNRSPPSRPPPPPMPPSTASPSAAGVRSLSTRPLPPPSASPVRISLAANSVSRPPPPPQSPGGVSPLRSPTMSTKSSVSSAASPMRPDSTMSTVSSLSIQDPDEEILRASGLLGVYENAILQSVLSKMNRDGNFEKNIFILTPEELMYFKMPAIKPNILAATALTATIATVQGEAAAAAPPPPPEPSKILKLSTMIATDLSEQDQPGKAEKRKRAFKILSRQKSFFVRAPTLELKDKWLAAIKEAASAVQLKEAGTLPDVAQTAPILVSSESNCYICQKAFTFFVRKNHCKNCGRTACEPCSHDRMRIPRLDDHKLFRVCNPCGRELKSQRVYGVQRQRSQSEEDAEAALAARDA